jgi:2-amino-4-hydroxy-6-hydroxymethyldihydropteridine diphosphokinase
LLPSGRLAWIAIGTNQGNPQRIYKQAVQRLKHHPMGIRVAAESPLYRTEPVGMVCQPWYINGVVVVETQWGPKTLLRVLRRIEAAFGRNRRREKRWGPRRLDLDILFHGERIIHSKFLELPHPRLHLRRFVLTPLAQVSPDFLHPIIGKTVDMLLQDVDDTARVELLLP